MSLDHSFQRFGKLGEKPKPFIEFEDLHVTVALAQVEDRFREQLPMTRTSDLLWLPPFPGQDELFKPPPNQSPTNANAVAAAKAKQSSPQARHTKPRPQLRPQSAPAAGRPKLGGGNLSTRHEPTWKRPYSGGSATLYLLAEEKRAKSFHRRKDFVWPVPQPPPKKQVRPRIRRLFPVSL